MYVDKTEVLDELIGELEVRKEELMELGEETKDEYYNGRLREVQITIDSLKEKRKWT